MEAVYPVYLVRISYTGNMPRKAMFDIFRRVADRLGKQGITAKKGQTDRRIRKKGYIRLRFEKRHDASAYIRNLTRLLARMGVNGVAIRRLINCGRPC